MEGTRQIYVAFGKQTFIHCNILRKLDFLTVQMMKRDFTVPTMLLALSPLIFAERFYTDFFLLSKAMRLLLRIQWGSLAGC